jgi:hypothetical protein
LFLTLLFPLSGLATALLSLAGLVFGLWPQLKLKRADIAVKHGEEYAALIKEAYYEGKGKWSAPVPARAFTPDDVRSFFERFWALQQSQFSFWRQGLLADDTLVYWLTRRLADLDNRDTFFGKTSHEGWDAVYGVFACTDFGAFMGALIEATRSSKPGELRRKVERALVASMTEGKGGTRRLLRVGWLYRWFAMSRPDLTSPEARNALATAIDTRHPFLESYGARWVSRFAWLMLIVLFGSGVYKSHKGGDPLGPSCCPSCPTTTTSTTTTSTINASTTTTSLSNTSTSTTSTIPGYACLPTTDLCTNQTFTFDRFNGSNYHPKNPPRPLEVVAREIAEKCPQASEIVVIGRADDEHFGTSPRGDVRSNVELAADRANTVGAALEAEFGSRNRTPKMQTLPNRVDEARAVEVLVFKARCAEQRDQ